jgi:hypothetical protein
MDRKLKQKAIEKKKQTKGRDGGEDIFLKREREGVEGKGNQLPDRQGVKGPNFRVGFPSNCLLTRSLQSSQCVNSRAGRSSLLSDLGDYTTGISERILIYDENTIRLETIQMNCFLSHKMTEWLSPCM